MRGRSARAVLETGRRLCFRAVVLGALILYRARAAGIFLLALALTAAAPLAETPHPALTQTSPPCSPPGTPEDLWLWPVVEAGMLEVKVEGGMGRAPVPTLLYGKGEQRIRVSWVGAQPAVIDFRPDQSDAPAWVNRGVLNEQGQIRLRQTVPCRWEQTGGEGA